MSLHFTTGSKKLENGNIRLNWVRMGFKKDFRDVLSLYGKLPHTDTFGIMDGEQELKDLKFLQYAKTTQGEREIQKEMKLLKNALKENKEAL